MLDLLSDAQRDALRCYGRPLGDPNRLGRLRVSPEEADALRTLGLVSLMGSLTGLGREVLVEIEAERLYTTHAETLQAMGALSIFVEWEGEGLSEWERRPWRAVAAAAGGT